MARRAFLLLIGFTLISLSLLALGVRPLPARAAAPFPLTLTDDLGRTVTLASPPRRIVSLAPSVTELLFALGVGDRVAGVTRWCDYPEAARKLPKVGDLTLSEERIAALRPDLIVGDGSLERPFLDRLAKLGWPVLAVQPRRVADVAHALTLLGRAVGVPEAGEKAAREYRDRLAKLTAEGAKAARRPGGPVRVFVWLDPDGLYTAGPGTFLDELITLAGGRNIAGKAATPWPLLSEEALLLADPEVIVVTPFPREIALGKPRWQGITAVRAGKVYQVDPDLLSRPGPRLLDGLQALIAAIRG
ncbi:MAG: ABC transporter substrate-binding protein [Chitinophagales bacterium]